ncbi:MAG: DUF4340 domain-containing protein [Clostridia bacterium]|nr:DUF4340 domain-containing protein [Clostridia bacterium]
MAKVTQPVRKKNKLLPLIILLAVLAMLIAGYFLLVKYNADKAEEESGANVSTVEVLKKTNAILTEITINKKDSSLNFVYENEAWVYPADPTFPLNGSAVATMVTGMTDIKAVSVVDTEGADVDSFGLDTPEMSIVARYSDGSEYTFDFGIINSYNTYRYMRFTGSDNIYMVESSLSNGFDRELKSFFKSEVWKLGNDAITASDVTSVVLESAGGKTATVEYAETIEILFNLMNDLDLSTWEDHYADETEMAEKYGISPTGDRVTVNYMKDTTVTNSDGTTETVQVPDSYTVYFGREFEIVDDEKDTEETETGSDETEKEKPLYFFYTQKGSTVVYSASKEKADEIFKYIDYVPPVIEEEE